MSTIDSPSKLASVLAKVQVSQFRLGASAAQATEQTLNNSAQIAGDMNHQSKTMEGISTALSWVSAISAALTPLVGGGAIGSAYSDTLRTYFSGPAMAVLHLSAAFSKFGVAGLSVTQDVFKNRVDLDSKAANAIQQGGQQTQKTVEITQQTAQSLAKAEGALVKTVNVRTR